jgi:hypothetical protein
MLLCVMPKEPIPSNPDGLSILRALESGGRVVLGWVYIGPGCEAPYCLPDHDIEWILEGGHAVQIDGGTRIQIADRGREFLRKMGVGTDRVAKGVDPLRRSEGPCDAHK